MINRKLEKEIINLIPSKTLKDEIYMRKHKFSDLELAQIVIEFASTWKEMMDHLFKLKKEIKEAKVVEYISQYMEIEQKQYELWKRRYPLDMYEAENAVQHAVTEKYKDLVYSIKTHFKIKYVTEFITIFEKLVKNVCIDNAKIYFGV